MHLYTRADVVVSKECGLMVIFVLILITLYRTDIICAHCSPNHDTACKQVSKKCFLTLHRSKYHSMSFPS